VKELTWPERIENYVRETGFPRALFVTDGGEVVGHWVLGNDYRVRSGYHGGYPATYLRRVRALFPEAEARTTLHLFSGKVDLDAFPGDTLDVNPELRPTYVRDAAEGFSGLPMERYRLVLADPPYSGEDADRYGAPMVNRSFVMRTLADRLRPGARVVWLDQVLPMYRKVTWAVEARIGVTRSTNHRFRVATVFRRRG
jgi:hypothetical protein